jgi:hypothetical protein
LDLIDLRVGLAISDHKRAVTSSVGLQMSQLYHVIRPIDILWRRITFLIPAGLQFKVQIVLLEYFLRSLDCVRRENLFDMLDLLLFFLYYLGALVDFRVWGLVLLRDALSGRRAEGLLLGEFLVMFCNQALEHRLVGVLICRRG